MLHSSFILVIVSAVVLVLGACTSIPDNDLPDLTFKHLKPISLGVVKIELTSLPNSEKDTTTLSHRFPISPHSAMKKWALHRLQLAGNAGTARFIIIKANVTETKLNRDKTITGLFKQEASERYDASVEGRLEILDKQGSLIGTANSSASWSQTVREDTSLTERRRIWFSMIEKLMARFNDNMEEQIQRYLKKFIV